MKTTIIALLALIPSAIVGQEQQRRSNASLLVSRAVSDPVVAERIVADVLAATRKAEYELTAYDDSLFWRASVGILSGEFGSVPGSAVDAITSAIVERSVTVNRSESRRALDLLYNAGLNGFEGASDAIYRVYAERREARILQDLSSLPWKLHNQPEGQGLPYLAMIATMNNDEFGESDVHNGLVGRPSQELLDVSIGGLAMLHMSESPEGRDMLISLEEDGTLNGLSLRWIRYDESGIIGDELCANLPELTVCVEKAELAFDRGHPTITADSLCSDAIDPEACRERYHMELSPCYDLATEDGNWTVHALTCRDDVMRAWIRGLRR